MKSLGRVGVTNPVLFGVLLAALSLVACNDVKANLIGLNSATRGDTSALSSQSFSSSIKLQQAPSSTAFLLMRPNAYSSSASSALLNGKNSHHAILRGYQALKRSAHTGRRHRRHNPPVVSTPPVAIAVVPDNASTLLLLLGSVAVLFAARRLTAYTTATQAASLR